MRSWEIQQFLFAQQNPKDYTFNSDLQVFSIESQTILVAISNYDDPISYKISVSTGDFYTIGPKTLDSGKSTNETIAGNGKITLFIEINRNKGTDPLNFSIEIFLYRNL